jgi:predicted PurR-regulated permease PerM
VSDRPEPAETPGPADFSDALTRRELQRASVWIGLAVAVALVWMLAQPLLLILGGLVFGAILDGGTRLLGRILPIRRGFRLAIVCLAGLAFLLWTFYFAGSQLTAQAEGLRATVQMQAQRLFGWAASTGLVPKGGGGIDAIGKQLMASLGQLTSWVGSAFGALSSLAMIAVIGIFLTIEPRLYERGVAWMLPMDRRPEFYTLAKRMGQTLRRLMAGRLLGMAVEALLGILTGLLAFLPNIGAIVSGVLIVLVGFSAGFNAGLWAIAVYAIVQIVDGYVIVPAVAKRSVDLAPALVLGAQLLFGALFGILGLALADPMIAMIKVLLEDRARTAAEEVGSPA